MLIYLNTYSWDTVMYHSLDLWPSNCRAADALRPGVRVRGSREGRWGGRGGSGVRSRFSSTCWRLRGDGWPGPVGRQPATLRPVPGASALASSAGRTAGAPQTGDQQVRKNTRVQKHVKNLHKTHSHAHISRTEITTSYLSEREVWKYVYSHTHTHTKMSRMRYLQGFMSCHAAVTVYGSEIRAKPHLTFDIFNHWYISN